MGRGPALKGFVEENLDTLNEKWLTAIVATYHQDSARFINGQEDRIANPMGYAIKELVSTVLNCLKSECDEQELASVIYPVVQMRAVQGFAPSEAVSFIYMLRPLVVEMARKTSGWEDIVLELDGVIFGLQSRAFDIYSQCREKLSEIKIEELKSNLYMLLRKSELVETKDSK